MSTIEKLIKEMLSKPRDFTYDDVKRVLKHYKYAVDEKKEGSRIVGYRKSDKRVVFMHRPHRSNGDNNVLIKALDELIRQMRKNGDDI